MAVRWRLGGSRWRLGGGKEEIRWRFIGREAVREVYKGNLNPPVRAR